MEINPIIMILLKKSWFLSDLISSAHYISFINFKICLFHKHQETNLTVIAVTGYMVLITFIMCFLIFVNISQAIHIYTWKVNMINVPRT